MDPGQSHPSTQLYLNQSKALIALSDGDIPQARDLFLLNTSIYVDHPHLLQDQPVNYLATLHNLLNLDAATQNREQFQANFDLLLNDYDRYFKDQARGRKAEQTFLIYWHIVTTYCVRFRETEIGMGRIGEFRASLDRMNPEFNPNDHLALLNTFFNFAILGLHAGDLTESNRFLNLVLNDPRLQHDLDIYQSARLFQMVLFYEKGEYDFVLDLLERYRRRRKKTTSPPLLAEKLIGLLERLSQARSDAKKLHFFEAFEQDLDTMGASNQVIPFLQNFNLRGWATSHL